MDQIWKIKKLKEDVNGETIGEGIWCVQTGEIGEDGWFWTFIALAYI